MRWLRRSPHRRRRFVLTDDLTLAERKRAAREAALARRDALQDGTAGLARQAAGHLLAAIGARGASVVSGYLAGRGELDPMPAMLTLHGLGHRVCVPVTTPRGEPLRFRAWRPGVPLQSGAMRIPEPSEGDWLTPDLLIVPLLAFDRRGYRLGYGGGYYDRTLTALRAEGPIRAIGFAFAAQEVEAVPAGPRDARLDAVVTEAGTILPE